MRDLFGVVPVTEAEIRAWLRQVPGLDPASPRAAHYVRSWDVAGKIVAAKLAGTFDQVDADVSLWPGA